MQSAVRVAYNTVYNYIQLVLNVVIGLITVRIVLQSLGDVDYGIYHLIAGVVTLMSFISESLSQTSIRFISVSLGEKDDRETSEVFASCFSLHVYMGIILCVILELVGLFLFDGFLNIPTTRLSAAKIVFHTMVISLFLKVTVTPFTALIISHEKFYYTALIGVIESILKLLIAIIVLYSLQDKLVVYGILMALVAFVSFVCLSSFAFFKYRKHTMLRFKSYSEIKNVIGFAGWTMLDVSAVVANRQGYAITLNKFFGPVINTVLSLAYQIEGHLYSVSASVINTFKPQILKSYGLGEKDRSFRLAMSAGKFGFSLMSMLTIPIIVMLPDVLRLWLGDYPDETVFFTRMMLVACLISQLTMGLVYANQATGDIKWFSIIVSSIRISALPISVFLLILGCPAKTAIVVYMICESIASISRIVVMHFTVGLDVRTYLRDVVSRIIPPFFFSVIICSFLYHRLPGIWGLIGNTLISASVYACTIYLFGLTKAEKSSTRQILDGIYSKLNIFKKDA